MRKLSQNALIGKLSESELKDYAKFFKENNLEKFELEENGVKIKLEKKTLTNPLSSKVVTPPVTNDAPTDSLQKLEEVSKKVNSKEETKANLANVKEIKSPITGTFYSAPSPDAEPFVNVGKKIKADDLVGIVEAMKVMNEIKAGVSGVVKEVLVQNKNNVVADQTIILIE